MLKNWENVLKIQIAKLFISFYYFIVLLDPELLKDTYKYLSLKLSEGLYRAWKNFVEFQSIKLSSIFYAHIRQCTLLHNKVLLLKYYYRSQFLGSSSTITTKEKQNE